MNFVLLIVVAFLYHGDPIVKVLTGNVSLTQCEALAARIKAVNEADAGVRDVEVRCVLPKDKV